MSDRARPEHHGPDGRFRNPRGSPVRAAGRGLGAVMWRRFRSRAEAVATPPGHVLPAGEVAAGLAALDGGDGITWIGHACFLIRLAGRNVLTDPYLSVNAGPWRLGPRRFVPPALPADALPPVDLLLLSHNHYDHMDAPALRALARRAASDGGETRVLVPLGLGRQMRRLGFGRVDELDWWDERDAGPLRVQCLPAVHFSRRGPFDRNRTLWAGFALDGGGGRLLFTGDTGYGPVFREIGERAGPFDLAIAGIGAYEPRAIMRASHTTPEEAVALARDVRARRVLGMHWGTVVLTDEPPFEPPARFRAAAAAAGFAEADAWLLRIGETRPLRQGWPANL